MHKRNTEGGCNESTGMDKEISDLFVFFFIKYLRTLGFDATNDIFAENAWYFRNALVRANYNDLKSTLYMWI